MVLIVPPLGLWQRPPAPELLVGIGSFFLTFTARYFQDMIKQTITAKVIKKIKISIILAQACQSVNGLTVVRPHPAFFPGAAPAG